MGRIVTLVFSVFCFFVSTSNVKSTKKRKVSFFFSFFLVSLRIYLIWILFADFVFFVFKAKRKIKINNKQTKIKINSAPTRWQREKKRVFEEKTNAFLFLLLENRFPKNKKQKTKLDLKFCFLGKRRIYINRVNNDDDVHLTDTKKLSSHKSPSICLPTHVHWSWLIPHCLPQGSRIEHLLYHDSRIDTNLQFSFCSS